MMGSCDQLRKLVAQVRPVGRMSLEPCAIFNIHHYLVIVISKSLQREPINIAFHKYNPNSGSVGTFFIFE